MGLSEDTKVRGKRFVLWPVLCKKQMYIEKGNAYDAVNKIMYAERVQNHDVIRWKNIFDHWTESKKKKKKSLSCP